jgi:hypothetical protein
MPHQIWDFVVNYKRFFYLPLIILIDYIIKPPKSHLLYQYLFLQYLNTNIAKIYVFLTQKASVSSIRSDLLRKEPEWQLEIAKARKPGLMFKLGSRAVGSC